MCGFQGYFPGLSRTLSFNFQDFLGGVGTLSYESIDIKKLTAPLLLQTVHVSQVM